ncbi:MAG: hypothetical protein PHS49_04010 [Candidatus Gracilibacteria bacterium]|nr:hypothetical protein [Candidatus Gracilibacteria bacterium]
MKKIKIIIALISLLVLTGCFNKENNNEETNTGANEVTNKKQEIIVNNVYEEIVDDKVGLKNATQDDLDKILQEEVRINNTPTSKYPFFEQNSSKKADLEEIKIAGGLEVTRGKVFTYGIDNNYSFISSFLSDNEKLYSFSQNGNSFFYLDNDYKELINKLKAKHKDLKVNNESSDIIYIEITNNSNKYILEFNIGNGITRDDLDNILQTNQKTKVVISLIK